MLLKRLGFGLSLAVMAQVLLSCGGGGAGGNSSGTPAVTYRVLNLTSGLVSDLTTINLLDPKYTSTQMVFRQIPSSISAGSAFWIAAFELTQEQWKNLVGNAANQPWRELGPDAITGSTSTIANLPASGLTETELAAAITTWNNTNVGKVAIPKDVQWEFACRGAATTRFFWGDSTAVSTVDDFAITQETAPGSAGPWPVAGSRLSNAFGLWDMAGNVREWVDRGTSQYELRGGGWSDNVLRCSATNHIQSVSLFRHALSGARLVLTAP